MSKLTPGTPEYQAEVDRVNAEFDRQEREGKPLEIPGSTQDPKPEETSDDGSSEITDGEGEQTPPVDPTLGGEGGEGEPDPRPDDNQPNGEVADLKTKLSEAQGTIASLEQRLAGANKAAIDTRRDHQSRSQELSTARKKIAELERTVSSLELKASRPEMLDDMDGMEEYLEKMFEAKYGKPPADDAPTGQQPPPESGNADEEWSQAVKSYLPDGGLKVNDYLADDAFVAKVDAVKQELGEKWLTDPSVAARALNQLVMDAEVEKRVASATAKKAKVDDAKKQEALMGVPSKGGSSTPSSAPKASEIQKINEMSDEDFAAASARVAARA